MKFVTVGGKEHDLARLVSFVLLSSLRGCSVN